MDLIKKRNRTIQFEGHDVILPLFLDYQSTTPLAPEVRERMLGVMAAPGNSQSASHVFGLQARKTIEQAQLEVAALINADPDEIIFTSGATEANNLALQGFIGTLSRDQCLITTQIEHSSILGPALALGKKGHRVIRLPVDDMGLLDLQNLEKEISHSPALISIQTANNEIGTVQNISSIGAICKQAGIAFHTDAAQATTTQHIDVKKDNITLLSLSGHKMYGPQGIGALYVRRGTALSPLILGGDQQQGLRSGTLPTALIAGFGEACRIILQNRDQDTKHLKNISSLLKQTLSQALGVNIQFNGSVNACIPGCISAVFRNVDGEDLLLDMPDIALSTGSACASMTKDPSHVLTALGMDPTTASQTVRIGLGRYVTETDVRFAANIIAKTYENLVT